MNSKRIYNPFTNSGNLSRKDIDTYRETSDEKVKHAIEKNALASNFYEDTLEGWKNSSKGTSIMKSMDRKFAGNNILLKWKITVTFLVVGAILISVLLFQTYSIKIEKKENQIRTIIYEKTDLIIPQEIEEMKELPKKEQIQISTIKKDYKIQQMVRDEFIASNESEKIKIENLPFKEIESIKSEAVILKNQSFGKEIYLKDLKLIDYRNYRTRPTISTKQINLEGTPASKENKNSNVEEIPNWKTIDIPYIDYLEKTMAVFSKGDNKKALSRFEIILKSYPSDLNANFYSGLCYFNLREFDKAINTFENCLNSEFNNFNEEAEWYLAKSYQANEQFEKAEILFNKIEKGNGYYSRQASIF